jgi:hypothetical protein
MLAIFAQDVGQTAKTGDQTPAILKVRVVDGDAAVYAIGSRATRGVTIQVTDETGKPVEAATVSFRLPEDGPTGLFATGGRSEIATTRSDGRAGIWGMQWNRVAGPFEIRITAEKAQTRAGIVCAQYLTDAADAVTLGSKIGPRRNRKWLWIAIAVGGAAAGGVAAAAAGGKPGNTTSTSPATVSIGSPTIILGHP